MNIRYFDKEKIVRDVKTMLETTAKTMVSVPEQYRRSDAYALVTLVHTNDLEIDLMVEQKGIHYKAWIAGWVNDKAVDSSLFIERKLERAIGKALASFTITDWEIQK